MAINKIILKDRHGRVIASDSFAALERVVVGISGDVGTPSATSDYNDGVLSITLNNIKGCGISNISPIETTSEDSGVNSWRITLDNGESYDISLYNGSRGNGISTIEQTASSEEDGGTNEWTITESDGAQTIISVKNGHKGTKGDRGNGIASVEKIESSDEDGGVNTWRVTEDDGRTTDITLHNGHTGADGQKGEPFRYSDFTQEQLDALRGQKGEQGNTGIYNPEDPDTPAFELSPTTGQSEVMAMTQKAVTDELEAGDIWSEKDVRLSSFPSSYYYIDHGIWSYYSSPGRNASSAIIIPIGKEESMPIKAGDELRIVANDERAANIQFLTDEEVFETGSAIHYATTTALNSITKGTEVVYIVPENTRWFYIRRGKTDESALPTHIFIRRRKADYKAEVDDIVGKANYIKATSGMKLLNKETSGLSQLTATDDLYSTSDFIPCKPNDIIHSYYGTYQAGTSHIHFYDENKCFLMSLASYRGSSDKTVYYNYTIPDESTIRYLRFCWPNASTAMLAINDKAVFRPDTANRSPDDVMESMYVGQTSEENFVAVGVDTANTTISLGHLKAGAKYRLIVNNKSNLTYFGLGVVEPAYWHYYGFNNIPVPSQVDFIARENDNYKITFRTVSEMEVSFTLLAPNGGGSSGSSSYSDAVSTFSLIKEAKWKSPQRDNQPPLLGLLHYSDIHTSNAAASRLNEAIAKYKAYIDDVLNTGDVVQNTIQGAHGIVWWENSVLNNKGLFVIGNHDASSGEEGAQSCDLDREYCYDNYFAQYDESHGVFPEGYDNSNSPHYKATYWHKDYHDSRVRLIGIDCIHRFDGKIANYATGEIDPSNTGWECPSNSQELWLIQKLNETLVGSGNVAEGYTVVIASHYPLDDFSGDNMTWDDETHRFACNKNSNGGRVMSKETNAVTHWHSYSQSAYTAAARLNMRNRTATDKAKGAVNNIGEIVKYWMENNFFPVQSPSGNPYAKGWYERTGEEGSYVYNETSDSEVVSGKTYYTGARFAAWLCGHAHKDMMFYPARYPNILNIAAQLAGDQRGEYFMDRADNPLAANYIAIDTYMRHIKLVRVGNTQNYWLRPTTYLCYDYKNRVIISEG